MALRAVHNEVEFGVGDTVRLYLKTQEAGRRQAIFEGIVLGIRGEEENKSFLVRRMGADKVGIEQIFPLFSPWIQKVEVKQKGTEGVRHAKLYFLRGRPKVDFDKISHRAAAKGKVGKVVKSRKSRTKKSKTHSVNSGRASRKAKK
ncbi:50S ribosomal protein L19 [Candidatus Microgenomates bacterium]|nr:50S ribosomal protein L19 [Candidatus Microgenomates bacterium]